MEWWVYAIVTMLFFSFGNIAMKEIMNSGELVKAFHANQNLLVPIIASTAVFLAVMYFLFLRQVSISPRTLMLIAAFLLLAGIGFVSLLKAVASGQIAPVTVIVSTSSVMVAILSVVILKDSLSIQQMGGIALTFVGVLLLIWK